MTREDTIKVLAILKAAYPASYRNITRDEANGIVMIWATQFANDPAEVVIMAIQKLIATSTFPPTISEVKSKMRGLYWEAEEKILLHHHGNVQVDDASLQNLTAIRDACSRYNNRGSNEPTLEELIGGVKNYLTDGKGQ